LVCGWGPSGEEDEFECCDDFAVLCEVLSVNLSAAVKYGAFCGRAKARVQRVGFAEITKVAHEVECTLVARFDFKCVCDRECEAGALQKSAEIADFAHWCDAGG
jgi:hypothetical protein